MVTAWIIVEVCLFLIIGIIGLNLYLTKKSERKEG